MRRPTTKKRKTRNKIYFSLKTQDAIVNFNSSTDDDYRSAIFQRDIYPALDKLIENLIHTYKFYKFETSYDDLKADAVCFLHDKLPRFTKEKGKAFSFFTAVGLNYLIMNSNKIQSKIKYENELDVVDMERDISHEYFEENRIEDLSNFIKIWIQWNYSNLHRLYKPKREQKIADAILTLFNSSSDLENFNKKYLYILIREQTDFTTSQITTTINKMKRIFKALHVSYLRGNYKWESVQSYKQFKEKYCEKLRRNQTI